MPLTASQILSIRQRARSFGRAVAPCGGELGTIGTDMNTTINLDRGTQGDEGHFVTIDHHVVFIKDDTGTGANGKGGKFTRHAIEKKILDHHRERGGDEAAAHREARTGTVGDTGQYQTGTARPFHFEGDSQKDLPGEVQDWIDGDLHRKSLFTVSRGKGASGADVMGEMGSDKYFAMADEALGGKLNAAKKTAENSDDPEMRFFAALHDNLPKTKSGTASKTDFTGKGGRARMKVETFKVTQGVMPASKLKDGHTFTINGTSMKVTRVDGELTLDGNGYPSTPLAALSEVPIDKHSLKMGKRSVSREVVPFSAAIELSRKELTGGRWVTIHPHNGEDYKRLYIGGDGTIKAGPKAMVGKHIDGTKATHEVREADHPQSPLKVKTGGTFTAQTVDPNKQLGMFAKDDKGNHQEVGERAGQGALFHDTAKAKPAEDKAQAKRDEDAKATTPMFGEKKESKPANEAVQHIMRTNKPEQVASGKMSESEWADTYVSDAPDGYVKMKVHPEAMNLHTGAGDKSKVAAFAARDTAAPDIVVDSNDKLEARHGGGKSDQAFGLLPHVVIDGKHRVEAAIARGDKEIGAMVPKHIAEKVKSDSDRLDNRDAVRDWAQSKNGKIEQEWNGKSATVNVDGRKVEIDSRMLDRIRESDAGKIGSLHPDLAPKVSDSESDYKKAADDFYKQYKDGGAPARLEQSGPVFRDAKHVENYHKAHGYTVTHASDGNIVARKGGKELRFAENQASGERLKPGEYHQRPSATDTPALRDLKAKSMEQLKGKPDAKPSRLDVLKQSLAKKETILDQKFDNHFADVKSANGQPLNDKRNGRATMERWDKQSRSIANQKAEIEKTTRAIDREQTKVNNVANANTPSHIQSMVDSGELSQWRKFPNRFFVKGVDKGRIVWNEDTQTISHSHLSEISKEHMPAFTAAYNKIASAIRISKGQARPGDMERAGGLPTAPPPAADASPATPTAADTIAKMKSDDVPDSNDLDGSAMRDLKAKSMERVTGKSSPAPVKAATAEGAGNALKDHPMSRQAAFGTARDESGRREVIAHSRPIVDHKTGKEQIVVSDSRRDKRFYFNDVDAATRKMHELKRMHGASFVDRYDHTHPYIVPRDEAAMDAKRQKAAISP